MSAGGAVRPPSWLGDNLCYETMMGTYLPRIPCSLVFPHRAGEIFGFGAQIKRFESWQEHHVAALGKSWDFSIFGIVKFFQLAMENNPNRHDRQMRTDRASASSAFAIRFRSGVRPDQPTTRDGGLDH